MLLVCLLLLLALLPLLLPSLVRLENALLVELVLLFDVQLVVLHEGVFAEISHVDVDLGLTLPHVFVHLLHEEVVALRESGVVLPDLQFILLELSLDVENKLLEVVFEDELVDD